MAVCGGAAFTTWAVDRWAGDSRHFHASYALYGFLGFSLLGVPSVLALIKAADVPFPTLVHSVRDLEDWLRQKWPDTVGPVRRRT